MCEWLQGGLEKKLHFKSGSIPSDINYQSLVLSESEWL